MSVNLTHTNRKRKKSFRYIWFFLKQILNIFFKQFALVYFYKNEKLNNVSKQHFWAHFESCIINIKSVEAVTSLVKECCSGETVQIPSSRDKRLLTMHKEKSEKGANALTGFYDLIRLLVSDKTAIKFTFFEERL